MSPKRKSELISKDDVVDLEDLSTAYGVEEEPPSFSRPKTNGASHAHNLDHNKIRSQPGNFQFKSNFANAMSQATRSLDESARSIQVQHGQTSTEVAERCTHCKYTDRPCNLEKPICYSCRSFRARGIIVPCQYTTDIGQLAEIPYGQTEVEVIDLDDDESPGGNSEEYEVEAIIARRSKTNKGIEYQVKWKDYPRNANTWEPVSNLEGAKVLIDGFEAAVTRTESSPSDRRELNKRPKYDAASEMKRSLSLGLVIVPRNPGILENQTSRLIPENVKNVSGCRLVPADETYQYLVDWHGLVPMNASWEPETRFNRSKSLIEDYHLATCLDFPSEDAATTTDNNVVDPDLISAGVQVIVSSHRTGLGSRLSYCFYDKEKNTHLRVPASELVSNEAQTAILLFVMRSKIMQGCLDPSKATVLNSALNRHGILRPERKIDVDLRTTTNHKEASAQNAGSAGKRTDIDTIVSHRLTKGNDSEHLVRWKSNKPDTWHSAQIVNKLPDGLLATQKYLDVIQKNLIQRAQPLVTPVDKPGTSYRFVSLPTTQQRGAADVRSDVSRFQSTSKSNDYRHIRDTVLQGRPIVSRCVQCRKADLKCEGTGRCDRCVTMDLTCVFAEPSTYEIQAAEFWSRDQMSKQPTRGSSKQVNAERRVPYSAAKSTSEAAWRPTQTQSTQPAKSNGASSTFSDRHLQKGPPVQPGRSRLTVNGGILDSPIGGQRRVNESSTAVQQLKGRATHDTTSADEKWISEHVSRTIASLSDEDKAQMRRGIAKNQRIMQASIQQKADPLFAFLRSVAEKELQTRKARDHDMNSLILAEKASDLSSVGRKDLYYEELTGAFVAPQKSYPLHDKYLLVKKTNQRIRPLPDGPHDRRNVASNVLLSIGKHPWLPGLNHHLKGLLDRGPGGRRLNNVNGQVRNARYFKDYKAPASMSEMTEANFRASLPMGGTPL